MTHPSRPTRRDPAIRAAAIDAILPEVIEWLDGEGAADARDDLIACLDEDGYAFAKALENRCYWDPDAELVEILGGLNLYAALRAAEKAWVEEHGITVPIAVGDRVMLRGQEAVIVKIEAETAHVIAQPVKPDGANYGATGGWFHPFEEAAPVASASPEQELAS